MRTILFTLLMIFVLSAYAGTKEETKKAPEKEQVRCGC